MSLGIAKLVVTPMQRLIVQLTAADPEPDSYSITLVPSATGAGQVAVTEQFSGTIYRSAQLWRQESYTIHLTAEYADPADDQVYFHPEAVLISPSEPFAVILRQSVWDILHDAQLNLDGRPVSMIGRQFQPVVLARSSVIDIALPAVEVGMPQLRTTSFASEARKVEEWRLPLRILDAVHKENPDELRRPWYLCEGLQRAVDITRSLNMSARGVHDKSWSWRVMEEPDQERDRMSGLKLWLTVPVQRRIG